ncbi:MAG: hypothetical protein ABI321_14630 [Polyangia bacterium]
MKTTSLAFAVLLLSACHQAKTAAPDDLGVGDASVSVDAASDLSPGADLAVCTRTATSTEATRALVVSHPFAADGSAATDYEVLALATNGAITRPGTHFSMGTNSNGDIVFTPDGKFGYASQDNGNIGIFAVSGDLVVKVIAPMFEAGAYASRLVMSQAGDQLYILDPDTTANHGGVYTAPIYCDGSLGQATLVTAADVPSGLEPLAGGDYALAARGLDGAAATDNVHRITLAPYARIASVAAFPDQKSQITGQAVTHDGKFVLFGDSSEFSGEDNRVAVVAVTATGLTATQLLTPIVDPYAILTSPYDNAAIVMSGYGNAIYRLTYDPTNATKPFVNQGELTYMGAKPMLPGISVLVSRGVLKGHAFIAEVGGVRHLQFTLLGAVTDLGLFDLGGDVANGLGVVGVQP